MATLLAGTFQVFAITTRHLADLSASRIGDMPEKSPTSEGASELSIETPKATFAYEAVVDIGPIESIGQSPFGERRFVSILGGVFFGPRLRGKVLAGGADRQLVGLDGVLRLDAHYELQTDDGAVITVRNRAIVDETAGRPPYVRSSLTLQAPEGPHGWVNRRIFVGTLHNLAPEPRVRIGVFVVE